MSPSVSQRLAQHVLCFPSIIEISDGISYEHRVGTWKRTGGIKCCVKSAGFHCMHVACNNNPVDPECTESTCRIACSSDAPCEDGSRRGELRLESPISDVPLSDSELLLSTLAESVCGVEYVLVDARLGFQIGKHTGVSIHWPPLQRRTARRAQVLCWLEVCTGSHRSTNLQIVLRLRHYLM